MPLTQPTPVPAGGTIRLVSPSMHVREDQISKGREALEARGYRVQLSEHCLDKHWIFGGTDADRAKDIMDAFLDPEVDAVMCTRGGYGAARCMPYLDFDAIVATGKSFFGFSDITTLHLAINKRGLASFYAPMAFSLGLPREAPVFDSLFNAMAGGDPFDVPHRSGECLVPGSVEADIAGGCLRLLLDSVGTPFELDTTDKILFFEDVAEKPHRVDACLTHLILSGKIQKCAGIVVGEMTDTDKFRDAEMGSPTWREIVEERLVPLGIPTIVGFPFGHVADMLTVPLGRRAVLDASASQVRLVP